MGFEFEDGELDVSAPILSGPNPVSVRVVGFHVETSKRVESPTSVISIESASSSPRVADSPLAAALRVCIPFPRRRSINTSKQFKKSRSHLDLSRRFTNHHTDQSESVSPNRGAFSPIPCSAPRYIGRPFTLPAHPTLTENSVEPTGTLYSSPSMMHAIQQGEGGGAATRLQLPRLVIHARTHSAADRL